VILFAIERFGNRSAGPRRIHRRSEPVLFQDGPAVGSNEIVPLASEARGLAAAGFEIHPAQDALR